MRGNFVIIPFPTNEGSATRMAVLRDVVDGKISNATFFDAWFWKLDLHSQVKTIIDHFREAEENFVIFIPSYKAPKFMPDVLVHLLQVSDPKPSAILWYLIDSIDRQANGKKITSEEYIAYGDYVDAVYTFDIYDSRKYGIPFLQRPVVHFEYDLRCDNETCVYFIGKDKGRLDRLITINRYLREHGVKCDFYVFKENKKHEVDIGDIHFIPYMKYDENIKRLQSATCVLSLAAKDNHMLPLSYEESILYKKKLITDCDFLDELPLYDKRFMKRFDKVDEIDLEWLCDKTICTNDYHGEFTTNRFLDSIYEKYVTGELRRNSYLNKIRFRSIVTYAGHFADIGWSKEVGNGEEIVRETQIESIIIFNLPIDAHMKLSVFQKKSGEQCMESSTQSTSINAGLIGRRDPIQYFSLIDLSNQWTIEYAAFVNGVGWTEICHDGEKCGFESTCYDKTLTGIRIQMRKKFLAGC